MQCLRATLVHGRHQHFTVFQNFRIINEISSLSGTLGMMTFSKLAVGLGLQRILEVTRVIFAHSWHAASNITFAVKIFRSFWLVFEVSFNKEVLWWQMWRRGRPFLLRNKFFIHCDRSIERSLSKTGNKHRYMLHSAKPKHGLSHHGFQNLLNKTIKTIQP